MKKPLVIAVFSLVLSACCDCDKVLEETTLREVVLPEVNKENCKPDNIRSLKIPKTSQQEFADRCFMGADAFKKSSGKSW